MPTRIQVRRDTATNWTNVNPTLFAGEIGFETDTGKMKIGDGSTAWASLAYSGGDALPPDDTYGQVEVSGDGATWTVKIGSESDKPIKTGTGGALEAGAFGTGAGQFAEGNHSHSDATTSAAGFMSATDKTKLDGIDDNAQVNVKPDWDAVPGDADEILNKPTLSQVATSGSYADLTGTPTISTFGASLIDDATDADARTTLGLGTAAEAASTDFATATHTHGNITNAGAIGSAPDLPIKTGADGVLQVGAFGTAAGEFAAGDHTHSDATTSASGFMSATDKTKLNGIADGAQVNVKPDWNATPGDPDEILNKPTLGTAAASDTGDFAAASHSHGNINSNGEIGATSGLVVKTTTNGAVTTLGMGTAGQVLKVNSTATDIEWGTDNTAAGSGGDVSTDTIWDAKGDLAVGTAADTAQRLAAGTDGQYLVAASGETTGLKWQSLATVADTGAYADLSGTPTISTFGASLIDDATDADARTTLGLGTAAEADSTDFATASHVHGNITNAGAIGSTSGLPIKTGTGGVLEVGAFGSSAGEFAAGDHTHTITDCYCGVIEAATAKDYIIDLFVPYARTVTRFDMITASGFVDITLYNNGNQMASVNSISTIKTQMTSFTNATLAAGSTLKLTIDQAGSPVDFQFTIRYTQAIPAG
jgi:hypothetical protein